MPLQTSHSCSPGTTSTSGAPDSPRGRPLAEITRKAPHAPKDNPLAWIRRGAASRALGNRAAADMTARRDGEGSEHDRDRERRAAHTPSLGIKRKACDFPRSP
ncbi:hypothetical protein Aple_058240 [Acrocarpospora pleiomorpha]|uniref:Uncharacterized protein n=1 Tax=Acrocarpospora pleiomorpha TaxID=90975 RepID=A0A5M3XNL0_9ACTN|nr:hypothetical protein Aple_058240 [Acrocarpospora pleiomorpha]